MESNRGTITTKNSICQVCPNGCHLIIEIREDGTLCIEGNRCERGLDYARSLMAQDVDRASLSAPVIFEKQEGQKYSQCTLSEIVGLWDISLDTTHSQYTIEGSPERTVFRIVIEDRSSKFYILEQISAKALPAKIKIAQTLEFLSHKGLPRIRPYIANDQGSYILKYEDHYWQMTSFLEGEILDRENYIYEQWRGEAFSRFLIELREKSEGMPYFKKQDSFSLKGYIYRLFHQIEKHRPDLIEPVGKVIDFLEQGFMDAHDLLPVSFCHGDYHPLNMIWAPNDIRAVIDWEFTGYKPEIYDMSNLIGCLGMEHPTSLTRDLVITFIQRMKASGIISDLSWDHLLEFIVAMRFPWLSEWLRKSDTEMIELEQVYMNLLIEKKDDIKSHWEV